MDPAPADGVALYREILNSLTDGIRLVEIQFDEHGTACEAIVRDKNLAAPHLEIECLERYAAVAQTGEPARFEQWSAASQRWYDVRASRIGGPGGALVAIAYTDITARKAHEAQLALLAEISQALSSPAALAEALTRVAEKVATFFDVKSCATAELLPGTGSRPLSLVRLCGWNREQNHLLQETIHLDDFLEQKNLGMPLSSRPVVLAAVAADLGPEGARYTAHGIQSLVIMPMPPRGRWRFQLSVVDGKPRPWSQAEIALLGEITQRIWTRVGIARAEEVLRHSEARQAFLLEVNDALRSLADPYDIEHTASRLLTRYLGVTSALYAEADGLDGADADDEPQTDERPAPPRISHALLVAAQLENVVPDGEPIVVPDIWQEPKIGESDRARLESAGVRALIASAVVKAGHVVARCVVYHSVPRSWTSDDVALVRDVGERTWAAIGRARKDASLKDRDDQLSRMNEQLEERVASRTGQIRRLFTRLIGAQEEERRRFARDVHDQLGQQMTAVRMQLEAMQAKVGGDEALAAQNTRTQQMAAELDQSIDFLTWQLRPAALDEFGLAAALQTLVSSWSERFGIGATLEVLAEDDAGLPADTELSLYRIAQEALHNVVRHAEATAVTVRLRFDPDVTLLVIQDNGRGFDARMGDALKDGGLGLASMRERATLAGGRLEIESIDGAGTSIIVRVFKEASP